MIPALTNIGFGHPAVMAMGALAIGLPSCKLSYDAITGLYRKIINRQVDNYLKNYEIISRPKPHLPRNIRLLSAVISVCVAAKSLQAAGLILVIPNIMTYAAVASTAILILSTIYQKGKQNSFSEEEIAVKLMNSTTHDLDHNRALTIHFNENLLKNCKDTKSKIEKIKPFLNAFVKIPDNVTVAFKDNHITLLSENPATITVDSLSNVAKARVDEKLSPNKYLQQLNSELGLLSSLLPNREVKEKNSEVREKNSKESPSGNTSPRRMILRLTLQQLREKYIVRKQGEKIFPEKSLLITDIDESIFSRDDTPENKISKFKDHLRKFMDIPSSVKFSCKDGNIELLSTVERPLQQLFNTKKLSELQSKYARGVTYTISARRALVITPDSPQEGCWQQSQEERVRKAREDLNFMIIPDDVRIRVYSDGTIQLDLMREGTHTFSRS